jgi:iron complex outermembrane receptor protein
MPRLPRSLALSLSLSSLSFLPALLPAQTAPAPATRPPAKAAATEEEKDKDPTLKLEQFVVTGVFNATEASKATTAISVVDYDTVAMQVPLSADDLLLEVAGVFVNSSLGEIRGMVYSRGISADSADGSSGHNYVSIQEDGLPITNVNFGNYGPGYFNRPDATLQRVEAVRGGSASITTSNSPGGAFNYLTRSGASRFGGEVRTRVGIEGRWSPTYRTDLAWGSPIGKTGWTYNAGAFYRYAEGHRPAIGYPMNDGFVLRGNLFKDYGAGSVKIYAKYMDDRNHWYEYLLARNPQDPKQYPGLSRFSTNLFPKTSFQFPREAEDRFATFDSTDAVRSRQRLIGVDWSHELPSGWSIRHNVKFSRNWADWNSSAGVTPRALDWPNFFSTMGFQFSGGGAGINGRVPPGTYRFTDRQSGALLAEVTSNGSYTVNANALGHPGQIVRFANLPNQHIQANTLWTNAGRVANEHLDEVMENFTITRRLRNMTFTAGGYFGYSDISDRQTQGGRTASPLTEQPVPVAITWIPAVAGNAPAGTSAALLNFVSGWRGQPVQLTNPEGFANLGLTYVRDEGVVRQLAYFFGHKWDPKPWLGFDWGFRHQNFLARGFNGAGVQNPRGNWDPTYGGADGNPSTMYDNRFFVPNPAAQWRYDKRVASFSWSAATNVVLNDAHSFYVRFADGEKSPDFQFFRTYTSQFRLDNLKGRPQGVNQWELGYRYKQPRYTLTATPFWSRLSNINSNPQATEADGATPYYPDPIFNSMTSYGLELEGSFRLTDRFSLRTVFTAQRSTLTLWQEFVAGVNGRDDDSYRDFTGLKSDNNPDFILRNTLSYTHGRLHGTLAWKHMGERAGNIANVIILPRFNQFDLNLRWTFSRRWSTTLTVNNLTDSEGVMTWRGWGVNVGDRQSFTELPPTGADTMLQYVPVQPRAYYVTTSYKF